MHRPNAHFHNALRGSEAGTGLEQLERITPLEFMTDPEATRMQQLAQEAQNEYLRRAAYVVLGDHGDEGSLATLISGLSAADSSIQSSCVAGLDRITGYAQGPGSSDFLDDPQGVIRQWQDWWVARQVSSR